MPALIQRLRRAWLNFLLAGTKFDIAMLRDRLERCRGDLYDLEAKKHALQVDLMQLEGGQP